MPNIPFTRRIMQITLLPAALSLAHLASAGTVVVARPVVTVGEGRPLLGYDIEYRYRGEVYASRLNYDPGERLRVRVDVSPEG